MHSDYMNDIYLNKVIEPKFGSLWGNYNNKTKGLKLHRGEPSARSGFHMSFIKVNPIPGIKLKNPKISVKKSLNKTKGLKLHRVIHLSTYVYLSTKFTYLYYHSLHLHLYPVYPSNLSFPLSYHIYSTFLPSLPIEPIIRSI